MLDNRHKNSKTFFLFFLFVFFMPGLAWAIPAVIYTKNIHSSEYNYSLHLGVREFREKTGYDCFEMEGAQNGQEYRQAVLQCIEENYSPIVIPYSMNFPDFVELLEKNKETNFILLDFKEVDLANVLSFSLANEEGAFLAGALAALMSKTKCIGFIYTSNTYPSLVRFRAGYIQGAKAMDPTIQILEGQLGDEFKAWENVIECRRMAVNLINQGVDVMFAAAGHAGIGALQAAEEKGIYAIGVDQNQNSLFPGTMIGSLVKATDKALFIALKIVTAGIYRDNIKRIGLAQDIMRIEFDGVEQGLVPEKIKKKLESIKTDIIQGKLQVNPIIIQELNQR